MASLWRPLNLLMGLLLLAGCAGSSISPAHPEDVAPSAQARATTPPATQRPRTPTVPDQPASTAAAPAATPGDAAPPAAATLMPTPEVGLDDSSFVVPADQSELTPRSPLGDYSYADLNLEREVQDLFQQVYSARTLAPGGSLSALWLGSLVSGAYADYTLPLFNREIRDAQAGTLLEVAFSDLATSVEEWTPDPALEHGGVALVSVTRTRTTVRANGQEPAQTATYRFRARRTPWPGGGVSWVVEDFFNPATSRWVSETGADSDAAITDDVQQFFEAFYAARTLNKGAEVNIFATSMLTGLSYQAYTLPLLERQIKELEAGALTSVSYRDIKTRVLAYDPNDTAHGGLATVEVTRTTLVTRPGGVEAPQTATLQFRLHRHFDDAGAPYWMAVDFFQPDARRWVSESAGLAVPVPPSGHG